MIYYRHRWELPTVPERMTMPCGVRVDLDAASDHYLTCEDCA